MNKHHPLTRTALAAAAILIAGWAWVGSSAAGESAVTLPAPALDTHVQSAQETAVFAGGCFWGVQAVFQHTKGVLNAVSGYAGGDKASANYDTVSSGRTGHAEAVQVSYDPKQISYGKLLQIYFSVAHDPTQLNRQSPDSGSQYRSTIFAQDAGQARLATAYVAQLNRVHAYGKPVVTTVETGKAFYPAEAYHQNFLKLNPTYPYIVYNDLPKIAALKQVFPALYSPNPVG